MEEVVLLSALIKLISLSYKYDSRADDCNKLSSFSEIGNGPKPRRSLQERPFPNPYNVARNSRRKKKHSLVLLSHSDLNEKTVWGKVEHCKTQRAKESPVAHLSKDGDQRVAVIQSVMTVVWRGFSSQTSNFPSKCFASSDRTSKPLSTIIEDCGGISGKLR